MDDLRKVAASNGALLVMGPGPNRRRGRSGTATPGEVACSNKLRTLKDANRSSEARPRPHPCGPSVRYRDPAPAGRWPNRRGRSRVAALAGGRGDLLAEEAGAIGGLVVGAGRGRLRRCGRTARASPRADHDRIAEWIAIGSERARHRRHSI
jgi:hypothetical protein